METVVKEVKTETKPEEVQEKWDKERQRADQAESVAAKARTEAQQYASMLEESKTQLAAAQSKLETSQKETQTKKDELLQMDTALVDQNVITNLEKLEARDRANAQKLDEMSRKLSTYEADRTERIRQENINKARESVLSQCDEEFSPKYRTEALKIADELVDTGKEKRPNDKFEGYILMKKCYRQVSEKETSKEKATVNIDTGKGGAPVVKKEARKSGSMKEVLADMKINQSWRNEPL
ncbi:MAG: hypothetical protein MUO31_06805 [Thermodesulfovibrionales bacterium]|nr:hypothetical protein [Thermodesulfovibrionales bacterium]